MIWQDDMARARNRRDWLCFYTGCVFTCLIILLVAVFVVRLTGGTGACTL